MSGPNSGSRVKIPTGLEEGFEPFHTFEPTQLCLLSTYILSPPSALQEPVLTSPLSPSLP